MPITIKDVLRKEHGGRIYYTGWLSAADIYDAFFVPVTKKTKLPKRPGKGFVEALEEREGGYQRCASRSRQREIAEFCIKYPTAVIPPVLASDRGTWSFEADGKGTVGTLFVKEKAAVVDGQHRLGGLRLQCVMDGGDSERQVQFVAVSGLSVEEEQKQFVVINNSQKGVPRAHTAFLEQEKWWNWVALQLNESGPFEGRIQAEGGVREPWHTDLKLHSVANTIKDTFSVGKKKANNWGFTSEEDKDEERKNELPDQVNRYWELISEIFSEEWTDLDVLPLPEHLGKGGGEGKTRDFNYKLLELTGFIAWMWFLDQYAVNLWSPKTRVLNESEVIKYLTWINEEEEPNPAKGKDGEPEFRKVVDWRKKGKFEGRTGGAGAKAILDAMVAVVQSKLAEESR